MFGKVKLEVGLEMEKIRGEILDQEGKRNGKIFYLARGSIVNWKLQKFVTMRSGWITTGPRTTSN